jgi:hypothetical protein
VARHRRETTALLPSALFLLGGRHAAASAVGVVVPAFNDAIQCLAVAVFLRMFVKRTWLVFTLSMLLTLPIAMTNLFTGANAALQIPVFIAGVALMFAVLLNYGLLALTVFPMTLNMARPYAASSVLLMLGIISLSAYGYYAARGNEPLFGRDFLEQS